MEKKTDKYHQPIQPDRKHLNPLFDVKEVPKRTYQIGFAALFTGIGLSVYDAAIGLYVSSLLVACFCFSILMFLLLKYNDAIRDLTMSIISMVCALLVFSACLEGLQSEQYLFFFPLLIAVPLLVDLKQTRYRKSLTLISIIVLSFIVCILIGRDLKPMETFTIKQINRLALANRIIAICSTIVFAALYTFFEKKYMEELTEQTHRAIDTKTQVLATMGHELRTPLNGIIGVVNLLKDEPDAAKQGEYIQIIQSCSDHMLKQVNDILDFNKIEAGKLEFHKVEFNLRELLLNTSKPFIALSKEKSLEFVFEAGPEIDALVLGDDLRLIQIFNNLLANAMKFTSGGFVKLMASRKKSDKRCITVSFSIEDSGMGIDIADQERVFESFWQVYDESTRQLTGTGLGLTICNRLLNLMGGTLILESEKGIGSKFSFDLSFDYAQKSAQSEETKISRNGDLEGVNILLVEDNTINMMVAKRILTDFKAIVTSALDGKEALDSMGNGHAFQLVLMDLEMPVMNGYTAIYEMKKLYPQTPVIALTASLVDQQMLDDLLASGFNDCMVKPYQPQELLHRIQKQL